MSRKMTEMGAAKIVGIDISTGMIDGAMTHHQLVGHMQSDGKN